MIPKRYINLYNNYVCDEVIEFDEWFECDIIDFSVDTIRISNRNINRYIWIDELGIDEKVNPKNSIIYEK